MGYQDEAATQLEGTSNLPATDVLALVRRVAETVKPPSVSLSLTRFEVGAGQRVVVEQASESALTLAIKNMKLVRFCNFPAVASKSDGVTRVRVGPLDQFKTSQPTMLGFIPTGSKQLVGSALYRQFLDAVADALRVADSGAEVTVLVPDRS